MTSPSLSSSAPSLSLSLPLVTASRDNLHRKIKEKILKKSVCVAGACTPYEMGVFQRFLLNQ
jgi:hypothetical protein